MSERPELTGIVLAGGISRRLGRNKAVEPVGGRPLILRVIDALAQLTRQTVVVVADEGKASDLPLPEGVRAVADRYPGKGSLGGIYSGLRAAESDWGVVVSCDMPFLNVDLLGRLADAREGFDAVVPLLDGRPESTHAIYSKACLPHMERHILADDLKIARFFPEVRVNYLSQRDVESVDPERLSFFNVNTAEDLHRALELVEKGHDVTSRRTEDG